MCHVKSVSLYKIAVMFVFKLTCLQLACITIGSAIYSGNDVTELPPGYIHYPAIRTAYKVPTAVADWENARQACESDGARLAVIDTTTKLSYVCGMKPPFAWVWVGISRNSFYGNWNDIEGNAISTYLPWAWLNPKLIGKCVAISGLVPALSNWFCDLPKMYVCEITDESRASAISFDVRRGK